MAMQIYDIIHMFSSGVALRGACDLKGRRAVVFFKPRKEQNHDNESKDNGGCRVGGVHRV